MAGREFGEHRMNYAQLRLKIGDNEFATEVAIYDIPKLIDRWFHAIGASASIAAQVEKLKESAEPLAAAVAANQQPPPK